MKTNTKNILALSAGAILLVMATAGASTYVLTKDDVPEKRVTHVSHVATSGPAPQRVAAACDDDNIVGKVVGGVAGGLVGNEIGSGKGRTAATIGGSVGGTLLGEEYIPTRNVTCH